MPGRWWARSTPYIRGHGDAGPELCHLCILKERICFTPGKGLFFIHFTPYREGYLFILIIHSRKGQGNIVGSPWKVSWSVTLLWENVCFSLFYTLKGSVFTWFYSRKGYFLRKFIPATQRVRAFWASIPLHFCAECLPPPRTQHVCSFSGH